MKRTTKKAMPFPGAGKADKSRKGAGASGANAERKASLCPALAMARLMGTYQKASRHFDELAGMARKSGDENAEHDFDRGNEEAFGVAETARMALAVAKAESLEGAFAKIVMSWEIIDDLRTSVHDKYSEKRLRMIVRLLQEDAVNYFVREQGIDLDAIGVTDYYGATGKPMAVIDKAWMLAREKVASEVKKVAA